MMCRDSILDRLLWYEGGKIDGRVIVFAMMSTSIELSMLFNEDADISPIGSLLVPLSLHLTSQDDIYSIVERGEIKKNIEETGWPRQI